MRGIGRGGLWKSWLFWALKWHEQNECHLAFGAKKVKIFRAHLEKWCCTPQNHYVPRHKTTGTLVVLCSRVLLCSVVVCCCVLLCVRGVGRSPCSCIVWEGIHGVGIVCMYSVGIHGCMLGGGRGCYTIQQLVEAKQIWTHVCLPK